jgi:hypothetical protein
MPAVTGEYYDYYCPTCIHKDDPRPSEHELPVLCQKCEVGKPTKYKEKQIWHTQDKRR